VWSYGGTTVSFRNMSPTEGLDFSDSLSFVHVYVSIGIMNLTAKVSVQDSAHKRDVFQLFVLKSC
jgi:hypothetical protein